MSGRELPGRVGREPGRGLHVVPESVLGNSAAAATTSLRRGEVRDEHSRENEEGTRDRTEEERVHQVAAAHVRDEAGLHHPAWHSTCQPPGPHATRKATYSHDMSLNIEPQQGPPQTLTLQTTRKRARSGFLV
jgi:hypothetical protein